MVILDVREREEFEAEHVPESICCPLSQFDFLTQGNALKGKGFIFPIMRQVQVVASSMIFLAFFLSKFVSHDFVYLAFFVGFGLALAGYTGICPMVYILQRMPWNNKKITDCLTSNKSNCCG